MKRLLCAIGCGVTAVPLALPASACPVADLLIDIHGISFSGFDKAIPQGTPRFSHGTRTADLLVVPLPNKKGRVPDGFVHSALIDTAAKQAWIRRRGGFAHVDAWYGPVRLERVDLKGCAVEAYR